MLKRIWQKIILEQQGQTLPIVLVLMLIGGLLVVPTLNYASTSLKVKQVTEKKTLELYAADAGVEEALSYLSQFAGNWSAPPHPVIGPYKWSTPGGHYGRQAPQADELVINGKTVKPVTIRREVSEESQYYYKITSTATSTDDAGGSYTTITSYVEFVDFSCLFDKLATSKATVGKDPWNLELGGETESDYKGNWPTPDQLREYYGKQIDEVADLYDDSSLDVDGYCPEGPLYRAGALDIRGIDAEQESNVLELQGTVYITGALTMGKTSPGNKKFTLDLSGETIFVEDTIEIKDGCTVRGSGCIIALGLVEFWPNISSGEDFVFIMSVESTVGFQPNPGFTGAIVAKEDITLHQGTYDWFDPPDDLKSSFLGGTDAPIAILSWQIS